MLGNTLTDKAPIWVAVLPISSTHSPSSDKRCQLKIMTSGIILMRCPGCGANISIPNGVDFCNCSYCGSQLRLVSEGGITLLREISKSVDDVHETVQRTEKTLNKLTQKFEEHFNPAPQTNNYVPVQSKEGFDWANLGSILFMWFTVAFIGGISGASWAIFWTPFLFLGRYWRHEGLEHLPYQFWEFKQKATCVVYTLLIAAAFLYKFG